MAPTRLSRGVIICLLCFQRAQGFVFAHGGKATTSGRRAPSLTPLSRMRRATRLQAESMDGGEPFPTERQVRAEPMSATPVNGAAAPTAQIAPDNDAVYGALIHQFLNPKGANLTATVEEFLDMCDYAFLMHMDGEIGRVGPESDQGKQLIAVGKEINLAMQRRLVSADANLRDILSAAPDIKQMEGKLKRLYRAGQVDMAFMVMLNMNLAQAREAKGAENAVMVLTHLNTVLMEILDERVAPEVRLLRLLLRTDCKGVREQMLKENLFVPVGDGSRTISLVEASGETGAAEEKGAWHRVAVTPDALGQAIAELVQQARQIGQEYDAGLMASLRGLEQELREVTAVGSARPDGAAN